MAYVTAPDRRKARTIARAVLEARLAACANLLEAESLYWWEGAIESVDETVIVFKTRRSLLPRLIRTVEASHPYDVPCVVSYPMGLASTPYVAWIDRETRAQR
jgi:periplasmic divalent cation tolerance protein